MSDCFCGSGKSYADCCEPYIKGVEPAPTAEALMRSRYSAYAVAAVDYLGETLHPDHREDWDRKATLQWAEQSQWTGLEVRAVEGGGVDDELGFVEFVAAFNESGEPKVHQERSRFLKHDGSWYYVDGQLPKPVTRRHDTPKVGRNDACPCGSGKKYKKCCGR